MEDAQLFERGLQTMRRRLLLMQGASPGLRCLRLDGVLAAVTPAAPDRSVANSVVYEHAEALAAVLDELAAAYDDAGVRAWTVWVPEWDAEAATLLEGAGHRLDASPEAMGLELERLGEPPGPEPEWSGDWAGLGDALLVNDRAYGDPEGTWGAIMGGLRPDGSHLYLSRADGRPASFILVHDHGDDCDFWLAATAPEARGRGLAGGLLHRALADARERGCVTSTTQATRMGRPIYERLGYRPLGALQMWERRRPAG